MIHDLNIRERSGGDRGSRKTKDRDHKGHDISLLPDSLYAFCAKCFISRRIRDVAWIATKRCGQEGAESWYVGAKRESWKDMHAYWRWEPGRMHLRDLCGHVRDARPQLGQQLPLRANALKPDPDFLFTLLLSL